MTNPTPEDPQAQSEPAPPPPPPPSYAPPPVPAPGQAMAQPGSAQGLPPNSDEKLWAWLAHGSYFVLGVIAPIIIMMTKGKESPFVRRHAVEALNFQISILIYFIVSFILIFVIIGIVTLIATIIFGVVYSIMAIIKAANGEEFKYPLTLRMVS